MSLLFAALDKKSVPIQVGENNNPEYAWSDNCQEKIVQLSFQLTRTYNEKQKQVIMTQYRELLDTIFTKNGENEKEKYYYGKYVYKLLAQTRDLIAGKGEYTLGYLLVIELAKRDSTAEQKLAAEALKLFVIPTEHSSHPYGSWKDIKYFLNTWKAEGLAMDHPIVINCVRLVITQLEEDTTSKNPSLLSKWVPRESSRKFGWQTELYARAYYPEYLKTTKTSAQYEKASTKCLMHFRQLNSKINKKLDTTQIKQCGNQWAGINPKDVTSITLRKQRRALLNKTKKGEVKSQDEDRIQCGKNFEEHIEKAKKGEVTMKGKRVGLQDMIVDIRSLLWKSKYTTGENFNQSEVDMLDLQWADNASQTCEFENMVAMVDLSASMEGEPMNAAIGLGLRVAEKSKLGRRVMTFSSKPHWINLEGTTKLSEMMNGMYKYKDDWGYNTNFRAALQLMLDACIQNKLPPEEVAKLVLVIFSDMQIDSGDSECNNKTMYESMRQMFNDAGRRAVGEPYTSLPHIVFWNLRSTSGCPNLSVTENTSMMAGYSPALLNSFENEGIDGLKNYTPWSMLVKGLDNERYLPMEKAFLRYWKRAGRDMSVVDTKVDTKEDTKEDINICKCEEYTPHVNDGPCRKCWGYAK
jgi:hypothetical protein